MTESKENNTIDEVTKEDYEFNIEFTGCRIQSPKIDVIANDFINKIIRN